MIADGTLIGRLTVRAPPGADAARRQQVAVHAVRDGDLAPIGLSPHAILIVRHVDAGDAAGARAAGGGGDGWAASWRREARARVDAAWRHAARPIRGPVDEAAEAVLFADRAEWLACLSRDVATASVRERWWWATWAGRGDPSLAQLWRSEARWLPAALGLLHRREPSVAARAAASLTAGESRMVRAAMAGAHAVDGALVSGSIDLQRAGGLVPAVRTIPPVDPLARELLALALLIHEAHHALRAPSPLLAAADVPITQVRAPAQTAELTGGAVAGPASRISAGPADGPLVARVAAATPIVAATGAPRAHAIGSPRPAPADLDLPRGGGLSTPNPGHGHRGPGRDAPPAHATAMPRNAAPTDEDVQAQGSTAAAASDGRVAAPSEGLTRIAPQESLALRTALGGSWYLVNVLRATGAFDALDVGDDARGAVHPEAWPLLAAVIRRLIRPVDPDPLWQVLEELGGAAHRPPPRVVAARAAAARAHLAAAGIRGRRLRVVLETPALLEVGRTHIDVTFDLVDLDIRVRAAGLDRDPGWVPELQRVIAFHYR